MVRYAWENKKTPVFYDRSRIQILVGTTGFEPAAFCSQSRRDTKLRYVPLVVGSSLLVQFFLPTYEFLLVSTNWRAREDSNP